MTDPAAPDRNRPQGRRPGYCRAVLGAGGRTILTAIGALLLGAWLLHDNLQLAVNKIFKVADEIASEDFLSSAAALTFDRPGGTPVLLLHMDEVTHEQRGRPAKTPRDLLSAAIRKAREGNARAILVDIDLSALHDEVTTALKQPQDQDAQHAISLVCELRRFGWEANPDIDCLDQPDDPAAPDAARGGTSAAPPLIIATPVMPEPGAAASGARWSHGVPVFPLDPDETVRDWYASDLNLKSGVTSPRFSIIENAMRAGVEANPIGPHEAEISCPDGDEQWEDCYRVPIVFTLDADDLADEIATAGEAEHAGRKVPAIIAARLVRAETLAPQFFADRVVVIGASHRDIRDKITTPRGQMPGALVIANAINSAPAGLATLQLHWVVVVAAVAAVAAYVLAGAHLAPPVALLVDLAVLAGLVLLVALWVGFGAIFPFLAVSAILTILWNCCVSGGRMIERWRGGERSDVVLAESYKDYRDRGGALGLALGLLIALGAPGAAEAQGTGWMIVNIELAPTDSDNRPETSGPCSVAKRGKKALTRDLSTLRVTQWIEQGEIIRNDTTDAQLLTLSPSDKAVRLEPDECVEPKPTENTSGKSVLEKIIAMATGGNETLSTRNFETLAVPILAGRPVIRLPGSTEVLDLTWVNGTPPFRIALRAGTELLATQDAIAEHRHRFVLPALAGPLATLELSDAAGETASYLIQPNAPDAVPPPEGGFGPRLVAAVTLLTADGGRWRLVGLVRLQALGARNPLARALAERLADGRIDWAKTAP